MTCKSALALIEPYIDGELDASQSAEARRHLDECPQCAAAHQRLARLSTDLRTLAPRYTAPEALRSRIVQRVGRQPVVIPRRRAITSWAVAATALLAVSAGWNLMQLQSRKAGGDAVVQEIVSSHVRSLIGDHLLDVPSTDQHNVKPWFNGRLDYSPDVKDFAAQGFALVGGRVDYLDHRPVAALVYRHRQHVINLFAWPNAPNLAEPGAVSGFNLVVWNRAGIEYCAISDLNEQEMQQFADLYRP
jgi:anti-sigma factor (TIGR02949 family)